MISASGKYERPGFLLLHSIKHKLENGEEKRPFGLPKAQRAFSRGRKPLLKKETRKVKLNPPSEEKEEKTELFISSWNINGLRAVNKRGDLKNYLLSKEIDILCLNEIRIDSKALSKCDDLGFIPKEYIQLWNCDEANKGRAGVAIFSKIKPLKTWCTFEKENRKKIDGRIVTFEFQKFFLVASYVPNSGQDLKYNILILDA